MENNSKNALKGLKVALVHDFMVQYGGAERVLEALSEMFPEAPIYTLLYDKEKMGERFIDKDIRSSYLQKFPKFFRKRYQWLLPFFMVVPETFDFRDYDLVISSTGAWTKGIVTRISTKHVAYLHSPMRFAWEQGEKYFSQFSIFNFSRRGGTSPRRWQFSKFFLRLFNSYLRLWDKLAAQRPDYLIANSKYTQRRIEKYYRRKSEVIYPPAFSKVGNNFQVPCLAGRQAMSNLAYRQAGFQSSFNVKNSNFKVDSKFKIQNSKFFLLVSRLSPYKKADVAVEAFNKLGLPLVIIGEGKQKKYLEQIAKNNVKILGFLPDDEVADYYRKARAFIFPADDDFGITIVEAMGHGVPVIAYRKGGALEIIEEEKTGEFFDAQTPEVLADAVRRFIEKENKYNKVDIINIAKEFSKERFVGNLEKFINDKLQIPNDKSNLND